MQEARQLSHPSKVFLGDPYNKHNNIRYNDVLSIWASILGCPPTFLGSLPDMGYCADTIELCGMITPHLKVPPGLAEQEKILCVTPTDPV